MSNKGQLDLQGEIRSRNADFTPGERKVARNLMSEFPGAGLLTVAELAKKSGVSGQTVLRFVSKLGFESYPDFQRQIIEGLKVRHDSPLSLYESRSTGLTGHKLVRASAKEFEKALRDTFHAIPSSEVEAAIELLSDPKLEIIATGGRFSDLLADYLIRHLHQIRPRTSFLPASSQGRTDKLIDLSHKSVIFVMDFRRYQRSTIDFARGAASKGCKIILVTDPYLSPINQLANVVLPIEIESPSAFDSQVAAMAMIELLIAGVIEKLGDDARRRIEKIEDYRGQLLDIYSD